MAKGALLGDLPEEATGGSRAAEKEDEGTDKPAKRGVIARLRRGPAAVTEDSEDTVRPPWMLT